MAPESHTEPHKHKGNTEGGRGQRQGRGLWGIPRRYAEARFRLLGGPEGLPARFAGPVWLGSPVQPYCLAMSRNQPLSFRASLRSSASHAACFAARTSSTALKASASRRAPAWLQADFEWRLASW